LSALWKGLLGELDKFSANFALLHRVRVIASYYYDHNWHGQRRYRNRDVFRTRKFAINPPLHRNLVCRLLDRDVRVVVNGLMAGHPD
jgi:hypothetical protein